MRYVWTQFWGGGDMPEPYKSCVDKVKRMAIAHGDGYELRMLDTPTIESPASYAVLKDAAIMSEAFLDENANRIYVDCDCYPLVYPGNVLSGVPTPYLGYTNGQPDTFFVIVNGGIGFFHNLVHEFVDKKIDHRYACWRKVLRDKPVREMPTAWYHHYYCIKTKLEEDRHGVGKHN